MLDTDNNIFSAFGNVSAVDSAQAELITMAIEHFGLQTSEDMTSRADAYREKSMDLAGRMTSISAPQDLAQAFHAYLTDAAQRTVLTLDALRKRGDIFLAHEAAGAPPVLIYDYNVLVDGATLARPCNYMLLEICPPEGVSIDETKRPYVIIDPRAGHGPGIGGFKTDSQVGVALHQGHAVYFVAFRPMPEPNQTLADVTHAEATFVREVRRRHPDAPKPVVVGNCQGGWATAILAATNPDLAGPIVLNGAPMSYWSGKLGQDPMRYTGGVVGGVLPAMIVSDLGGGIFDGANLVLNFEMLNPGRTWFRKYYDIYASIDKGEARFLEFEKWWGGFFLMNEAEIRWIVEQLFVGNRLGKNEARLETGRPIDLKAIRAPIIVFASHGDNITPPQQALNWILDTFTNEHEIEIRGQRILYMVHEQVGHLGIFVSSSVAKREHSEMAETMRTIEALSPGLYEMIIEDHKGEGHAKTFSVSFARRKFADILELSTSGRREEAAFAAVARMSENMAEAYDGSVRPMVKSMVTPDVAAQIRDLHPLRVQRKMFATTNPMMAGVEAMAGHVRANRQPVGTDNPFVEAERLLVDAIEMGWDMIRDARAIWSEAMFLSVYASPWAVWFGEPRGLKRSRKAEAELEQLPEVLMAVERVGMGGFAEAVIRMLVLLAGTRSDVRRDRLQRSHDLLTAREPFASLERPEIAQMIHEQTLIVRADHAAALDALPQLLPTSEMRQRAVEMVEFVLGEESEMAPATVKELGDMRQLLESAPARNLGETAE